MSSQKSAVLSNGTSTKNLNISTSKDKVQAMKELSQELKGKIQTTRQKFNELKEKKGNLSQRGGTPVAIPDPKDSFARFKEEIKEREDISLQKITTRNNIPLP